MSKTTLLGCAPGVRRNWGISDNFEKAFVAQLPRYSSKRRWISGDDHPSHGGDDHHPIDGGDADNPHKDNHTGIGNNRARKGNHFHNTHNHCNTLHILAGSRPQGPELQAAYIFYPFDHFLSLPFK
jgi:hypothetical protein